jgi:hypothetical protein
VPTQHATGAVVPLGPDAQAHVVSGGVEETVERQGAHEEACSACSERDPGTRRLETEWLTRTRGLDLVSRWRA